MTQEIKVNSARFTELWRPVFDVANDYKRRGFDLTYCEVREIANTNLALFFDGEQREVPHLILPCILTSEADVLGLRPRRRHAVGHAARGLSAPAAHPTARIRG